MSDEQCWGLNPDRTRCQEPAEPGQFFCADHDRGFAFQPLDVFCLPEAEMPHNLVAHLRACSPNWPFPEPSPPITTFGPAAPAAVPTPLKAAWEEPQAVPEERQDAAPPESDGVRESLGWLMAAVRHSIEELLTADVPPLPRANTIARLGGLYLRAYRATELTKENRRLHKEVAELAARLAAAETPGSAPKPRRTPPAGSEGGSGDAVPGSAGILPAPLSSSRPQDSVGPTRAPSAAPGSAGRPVSLNGSPGIVKGLYCSQGEEAARGMANRGWMVRKQVGADEAGRAGSESRKQEPLCPDGEYPLCSPWRRSRVVWCAPRALPPRVSPVTA